MGNDADEHKYLSVKRLTVDYTPSFKFTRKKHEITHAYRVRLPGRAVLLGADKNNKDNGNRSRIKKENRLGLQAHGQRPDQANE
ncbi:hypothetical protein GCM10027592_62390 [Spirosoma flavus]